MAENLDLDCGSLNATECLLRVASTILEEVRDMGEEYNWDPLTFGTTLIIGIVALFFAALTIGQGLMMAGPGRHKCSKYALGSWAQLSQQQMDWSEMRFRSIAHTPVINIEQLMRRMWPVTEGWDPKDASNADLSHHKSQPAWITTILEHVANQPSWIRAIPEYLAKLSQDRGPQWIPKGVHEYFPATWLALLTECGLDHPCLWNTKPTGTDYIPADLAAAPAYASVRDLITLAALTAHPRKILLHFDKELGLPTARGAGFDLEFRRHALLGIYGVFQSHFTSSRGAIPKGFTVGAGNRRFDLEPVSLRILLHANGYVPQHKCLGNPRDFVLHEFNKMDSPRTYARRRKRTTVKRLIALNAQCRCFPPAGEGSGEKGYEEKHDTHRHRWQNWCAADKAGALQTGIFARMNVDDGGLELLAAEATKEHPVLFPWRWSRLGEKLKTLLPLSCLWLVGYERWREYCTAEARIWPGYRGSYLITIMEPESFEGDREGFSVTEETFLGALRYVASQQWSDKEPEPTNGAGDVIENDTQNLRYWGAENEVGRIDRWLEDNLDQSTVMCRMKSLAYAAAACSRALRLGESIEAPPPDPKSPHQRRKLSTDGIQSEELCKRVERLEVVINHLKRKFDRNAEAQGADGAPLHSESTGSAPGQLTSGAGPGMDELSKLLMLWSPRDENNEILYPTHTTQHPLDDLLIYRAVLIAILYNDATDCSEIITKSAYMKVVPVI